VPLGYDAKDKKLVINKPEAETVRYIFKRYLEVQSFGKLVADLDAKGIVTKRRDTKVRKFNGGIPFTYGPLAYFLKNRIYVGETGHKEKWFPGEHAAIVDRKIFDQVQQLLASQPAGRKARRTASEALLMGKLYDDRGNRMSPSFSAKNGVHYRFYVSSALLRGRKADVGSVGRVPAAEIESTVLAALKTHQTTGAIRQCACFHWRRRARRYRPRSPPDNDRWYRRRGWVEPGIQNSVVDKGERCSSRDGRQWCTGSRAQREPDPVHRSRACLGGLSPRRSI
jgi:hypothetical protein